LAAARHRPMPTTRDLSRGNIIARCVAPRGDSLGAGNTSFSFKVLLALIDRDFDRPLVTPGDRP